MKYFWIVAGFPLRLAMFAIFGVALACITMCQPALFSGLWKPFLAWLFTAEVPENF